MTWEGEHIVPKSAGGDDRLDNMALSCRPCNRLKGTWDPRRTAGRYANRDKLVAAVRRHLAKRRAEAQRELAEARALIGREIDL